MKTMEELIALRAEAEALNKKFADLTDEELAIVAGGDASGSLKYEVGQHVKVLLNPRTSLSLYGTILFREFGFGQSFYTVHYVCSGQKWGSYYQYTPYDHTNDCAHLDEMGDAVTVIPELPQF